MKWQYFQDFAFSPYNKLEDWAYDIKKTIGWQRIESLHAINLVWLKKEFIEAATRQINGEIEVIGDQRKWTQIGNTLCLESSNKTEPSMKKIGYVLENKNERGNKEVSEFKIKRYIQSLSQGEFKGIKDEVHAMVRKESFNPNLDENNTFFKSMVQAKINLLVLERIEEQEKNSIKSKLKVVGG